MALILAKFTQCSINLDVIYVYLVAIKIDNIYDAVYRISLSKCLARDVPTVNKLTKINLSNPCNKTVLLNKPIVGISTQPEISDKRVKGGSVIRSALLRKHECGTRASREQGAVKMED